MNIYKFFLLIVSSHILFFTNLHLILNKIDMFKSKPYVLYIIENIRKSAIC